MKQNHSLQSLSNMFSASRRRSFSSVRRAVYDIGSGSIKFQIADVDLTTNKIVQNHIQKAEQVLFINKNEFSKELQMDGLSKLKKLQNLSETYEVIESIGVATHAFRTSSNGRKCLDLFQRELNVPMTIVSSSEEARLGFESAKAINYVDEGKLLVWDCGAGSFQLTSKEQEFSDQFGSGTILNEAEKLGIGHTNPRKKWTEQDFQDLILYLDRGLKPFPTWVRDPEYEWIAVGSIHSIFNQQRILSGKNRMSPQCVEATINDCLGLDNYELHEFEKSRYEHLPRKDACGYNVILENAKYILPKLVLLLSVMTKAGVPKLTYTQTNGNCNALLTNSSLWEVARGRNSITSNSSTPGPPKDKAPIYLTVNWHLEKDCNYKCEFCYAHFDHVNKNLDRQEGFELINALRKEGGFYKINFAGGEPLLNKNLGEYIRFAKEKVGLKTSVITNASLLTNTWIVSYGPYLDQIGVSCDSLDDNVQKQLGRGYGRHVEITKRAFSRIRKFNQDYGHNISIKLNTVVLRHNYMEDWSDFIIENGIQRWKIFKILKIEGENHASYDDLSITEEQFQAFVDRHKHLESQGVSVVEENNSDMTQSYIMVSSDGKFYQNSHDKKYKYSDSILRVGAPNALQQVGFDSMKFVTRGGSYEL